MKRLILTFLTLSLVMFTSCKKCDPTDRATGIIIEDAVLKITTTRSSAFIHSDGQVNYNIKVSFDGGYTYEDVDWSKYSVFGMRTNASCSTGYSRDVTTDDSKETVTYTIELDECPKCEYNMTTGNWVLTKKVPSHYEAQFVLKQ